MADEGKMVFDAVTQTLTKFEKIRCSICAIRNDGIAKTEIQIASGPWTDMFAEWEKGVLSLYAYGDGKAYYKPNFCPECGRRVNED